MTKTQGRIFLLSLLGSGLIFLPPLLLARSSDEVITWERVYGAAVTTIAGAWFLSCLLVVCLIAIRKLWTGWKNN